MKIEQVTIKNFKCLKDISITLKNITLITGVNSSGKSSFIQTLLLVKQNINNIIDIVAFDSLPKEDLNNIFIEKMNKMIREKSSIILDGHYLDLVEAKEIL